MWSLHAFLDDTAGGTSLEAIAGRCASETGDQTAVLTDEPDPLDARIRGGIRISWPGWWAIIMLEDGDCVGEDVHYLSNSRTPPAATRRRLSGCTRRIRALFGPDDSRNYTDHIVGIVTYLEDISSGRVYDPQRREFTRNAHSRSAAARDEK